MSTKNIHITDYLNYYLELQNPPGYAVMLQGSWGSGKTWYINDFIEQHQNIKLLRVSLYGVSSYKEIENLFFEQLHPFLSSKAAKFTRKLLTGVVKATLKLDLDGDNKGSDVNATISIPEFVDQFNKNADGSVLIFDDVERCAIKTVDLLGYINQYVENYGLKVILIANEPELIKKDSLIVINNTPYLTVKEKLIGKTFDIEPDVSSALGVFIAETRSLEIQKILMKYKSILENTYEIAGYRNLRHLKQTIMDFDRFYDFLPDNIDKKKGLIEHMISMFFALSIEIKKGEITTDQVPHIFMMDYLTKSPNDEPTTVQKIAKKYPVFGMYHHPLDAVYFSVFFKQGTLNKSAVNTSIQQSIYFSEDRKPVWVKLFDYEKMEDDDFKSKLEEVWSSLEEDKITDKHVFLHTIALLLYFSEIGLLSKPKADIIKKARKTMKSLKDKGKLLLAQGENISYESAFGTRFFNLLDPDFQKLLNEFRSVIQNVQESDLPRKAHVLLELLKQKKDSMFLIQLTLSNSKDNLYFRIPILQYINPDEFVDAYLALHNELKYCFFDSLESRYKFTEFNAELKSEKTWWQIVLKKLNKKILSSQRPITKRLIEQAKLNIAKYIDILESI